MKENPKIKAVLLDNQDNPISGSEFIGWYSRSVAVTVVITDKSHKHFLLEKRGPGCPDNIGKWCFPCGYVSWDETCVEAGSREVFEEIGLIIFEKSLKFIGYNDNPSSNRQNITMRFLYDSLTEKQLQDLIKIKLISPDTEKRGGEKDECAEIRLFSLDELPDDNDFAFNHNEIISSIASKHAISDIF